MTVRARREVELLLWLLLLEEEEEEEFLMPPVGTFKVQVGGLVGLEALDSGLSECSLA